MELTKLLKLRSVFFDHAETMFLLLDKNLNIIDINDLALKTFHFKRENILGKNISETSPDHISSGRNAILKEVIRTGKTVVMDEFKTHPSLGNFYFRVKAFKVGQGVGIVTKNITDLKETIEELETFIYKASHDMRSPIASILGITTIAADESENLDKLKHYCAIVQKQTQRLDTMLQILTETMRIRKGMKSINRIDFNELIDDVLDSLAYVEGFNVIRFVKHVSLSQKNYLSDRLLLISVFQNLIENAIKYRRNIADAYIEIGVEPDNGGIKITVSDNGIGIIEEMQKDIFNMFFRATNTANGSGLGLYTVKHTVKKLGGLIFFQSKENVGTTFTVLLPDENNKEQTG